MTPVGVFFYVAVACLVAVYVWRQMHLSSQVKHLRLKLEVVTGERNSLMLQQSGSSVRRRVETHRGPMWLEEDYGFSDPNEPTADELAEVYRSLGCEVPPSILRKISERDKVLNEILADLDALGEKDSG